MAVLDRDDPGTKILHARDRRAGREGKFWPVEYQPPVELADAEYPLTLSTGRTLYHYNSATMTMREAGSPTSRRTFEISVEDASALGLAEGDWARLVSRRGDLEARASIRIASTRASSGWRSTSRRRR